MDEQAKNKAPLTMKSLQERITTLEAKNAQLQERIETLETDFAAKLSQLEIKYGLMYEDNQQLRQEFQDYNKLRLLKKILRKK